MNAAAGIAAALGGALALGCASGAPVGESGLGVRADVVVLDRHFVQFEGERLALEWFLLEMRERARAAGGDPAAKPWVHVAIAPDSRVDGRWVSVLRGELYKAGISRITLGE